MKNQRLILIALGLIAATPFAAFSEIGLGVNNGGTYFAPYEPQPLGVQIFDDSVFKLKGKRRPVYSHEGRFLEGPPDFSEAQRKVWIQECKGKEKHSFKRFQTCFENKKSQYEKERGEMMRRDADIERQDQQKQKELPSERLDPYP